MVIKSAPITVTVVDPLLSMGEITGTPNVCVGNTTNLANNTLGGTWQSSNTNIASVSNDGVVTGKAAGTVNIQYTVWSGGCSKTKIISISVIESPVVPTALSNSPLDAGNTLNLFASSVSGATYTWSGPNNFTSNLQNPSISNVTGAASGPYSVTATVGGCTSEAGTVNVSIITNQAPVTNDDIYSTHEDNDLTVAAPGVLSNDTDVDGNTLTVTLISAPSTATGTLVLNSNGSFTFTPAANFHGAISFTYKTNDGTVDSEVATVSITVNGVNDAPVAKNDAASTDENVALTVQASTLLANDTDEDGDRLTVTGVSAPSNGTVALNEGVITFTPTRDFNGIAGFTYTISDGSATASAAVTVTLRSVNDAPVADALSVETNEDEAKAITLTGSDVESSSLTYAVVSGPANGTLSGTAPNLTYTPRANFFGADEFTFSVTDGDAATTEAKVTINVASVNDAPVVANAIADVTVLEDAVNTVLDLTSTFSDVDHATLTVAVSGNSNAALVTPSYNGTSKELTLAYAANGHCTATIKVKATDADGTSVEDEFVVTVTSVNDAIVFATPVEVFTSVDMTEASRVTGPIPINTKVWVRTSFRDVDAGLATSYAGSQWNWGVGYTKSNATITRIGTSNEYNVFDSFTYSTTGVNTLILSVVDGALPVIENSYQYVVIYDPNAGFVTGGVTFNSPAGAYKLDVDQNAIRVGRGGFVAKYRKGSSIVEGNTDFELVSAGLHYKSSSYEAARLVVGENGRASYKGTGRLNGVDGYGFMVIVHDAQYVNKTSTDKDRFRIKIWVGTDENNVIYDNEMGKGDDAEPTTNIIDGSIVIHNPNVKSTTTKAVVAAGTVVPETFETTKFQNYPNPYNDRTTITFSSVKEESFALEVYDVKGALVRKVDMGVSEAGKTYSYEF